MKYDIEEKIFVNDAGNQVKYKRLVITGYLNGNIETIELPISREQAIIYTAMKGDKPVIESRKANSEEIQEHSEKVTRSPFFDTDEEESEFLK